jgi:hypothetical protein
MRVIFSIVLMSLISCGTRENRTADTQPVVSDTTTSYVGKISKLQTAVLDSLARKYRFTYTVGISCDNSGEPKPCSYEIDIPKHQFKQNSLGERSRRIAEAFAATSEPSPMVKDIVIKFISETVGNVGFGNELTYTYALE